jgi:hypothetical protein
MKTRTYIPVKNCNIVQIEADVAITSLNPSIAYHQEVIFCANRQREQVSRSGNSWKQINPTYVAHRTSPDIF